MTFDDDLEDKDEYEDEQDDADEAAARRSASNPFSASSPFRAPGSAPTPNRVNDPSRLPGGNNPVPRPGMGGGAPGSGSPSRPNPSPFGGGMPGAGGTPLNRPGSLPTPGGSNPLPRPGGSPTLGGSGSSPLPRPGGTPTPGSSGGSAPRPSAPPSSGDSGAKEKSGGGLLGGRLGGGDKGEKKADKPSGGGPLGGLGGISKGITGRFGGGADDKPATPKGTARTGDNKAGGGGLLGRFGRGDKAPASPTSTGSMPAVRPGASSGSSAPATPRFGSAGGSSPLGGATPKASAPKGPRVSLADRLKGLSPFKKGAAKPARQRQSKPVSVNSEGMSLDTKLDILGVALILSALALVFSAISTTQGQLTGGINHFLAQNLGWGALAAPVAMFAVGVWLILRHFGENAPTLKLMTLAGIAMLYVGALVLFQYIDSFNYVIDARYSYLGQLRLILLPQSYMAGQGGGWVGAEIYYFLVSNITEIGGFFILVAWIIIGVMLTVNISAAQLAMLVISIWRSFNDARRRRAQARAIEQGEQTPTPNGLPQIAVSKPVTEQLVPGARSPQLPAPGVDAEERGIPIMAGGRATGAFRPVEPVPLDEPAVMKPAPAAASAAPAPTSAATTPAAGGGGSRFGALAARMRDAIPTPGGKPADAAKAPDDKSAKDASKPAADGDKPAGGRFGALTSRVREAMPSVSIPIPGSKPADSASKPDASAKPADASAIPSQPAASAAAATPAPVASVAAPAAEATEDKPAAPGIRPSSVFTRPGAAPPAPAAPADRSGGKASPFGFSSDLDADDEEDEDAPPARLGSLLRPSAGAPPTASASRPGLNRPTPPTPRSTSPFGNGAKDDAEDDEEVAAPTPGNGALPRPGLNRPAPPTPSGARSTSPFGQPFGNGTKDETEGEDEDAAPTPRNGASLRPGLSRPTPPMSPFGPPFGSGAKDETEDEAADETTANGAPRPGLSRPTPPMSPSRASSSLPSPFAAPGAKADAADDEDSEAKPANSGDQLSRPAAPTGLGARPTAAGLNRPVPTPPAPRSLTPPQDADIDEDADTDEQDEAAKPGDLAPARPKGFGPLPRPSLPTPFNRSTPSQGDRGAAVPTPQRPMGTLQERMEALRSGKTMGAPDDVAPEAKSDEAATEQATAAVKPTEAATQPATPAPTASDKDKDAKVGAAANADVDPDEMPTLTQRRSLGINPFSKPSAPSQPVSSGTASPAAFQMPEAPKPPTPARPPGYEHTNAPPPATLARPAPADDKDDDLPAPPKPLRPGRRDWKMPDPAKLLKAGMDQELSNEDLRKQARKVEETLSSFGAPGRVVEIRPGPVITQFGVEPDYLESRSGKKIRVKVSAIAQLDKDIQLALGARSIRIEAPVPGKGYVGIEVPNPESTVVRLRDVLESPSFRKIKSPLGIALGLGVDGTPVAADLAAMPHLLIAGTTGSGKSVCVNTIIASLLLRNSPDRLKFIMVDPKRVELTGYNGIPHLVAPVVVELERIVSVLKWVTREMDERYKKFSAAGARNIEDFNKHLPQTEPVMPYIVVIIDELADLMMMAPDETERVITRIAALARATGIHLVIATQRPSVDVVTGLIKANFPARIAFAVAGGVDSRVILDQPGAEKLLGRGDMLYLSGDAPAPVRLQGVYVSDDEINNLTRFWREQTTVEDLTARPIMPPSGMSMDDTTRDVSASAGYGARGGSQRQPDNQIAFWDRELSDSANNRGFDDEDEDGDGDDSMYEEAVELVRRLNKASVSLLQRRLRIGYTRAARLIDIMEQRGIVGPATEGSKPRDVVG